MAAPFSRSLRTLHSDSPRRSLLVLLLAVGLLALWSAWFVSARVAVFAATSTARLEVDREQHHVGVPVAGRIVRVDLAVGRRVNAGDVLLELDADAERLAMAEADVRLAPATSQIASLKRELVAQQRALQDERRSSQSGMAEMDARSRQAAATATFAVEESSRQTKLHASGLVSEVDALRAKNAARERADEAESAEFAARRARSDFEVRSQDRLAGIARLERDIAELESQLAGSLARSTRLRHDIDRRAVRAPISGTIAEVAPVRAGSVLAEGDRICTIIPDGELKVVAFYTPGVAMGRVQPGQRARVRLEAYPWTQYGSASARVASVAGEPRDGQIRVELTLEDASTLHVPVQHGLPAEVDVEVEQVAPATLVLRTVASRTRLLAWRQ